MIGLIAARSKNNVIGKKGRIPWQIDGEQKQFKELTTGNIVVMGRRTFEEIGKSLPDRFTIVVSRTKIFKGEKLMTVGSVKEALKLAKESDLLGKFYNSSIFFAGGSEIYREALPFVDVMYITEVDIEIRDGDTFFPKFNPEAFELTVGESGGDKIKYTRTIYRRL